MLRRVPSWQLILADLALILFLVTLSALAGEAADELAPQARGDAADVLQVAQAQALFRPDPLGPTLAEWLAEQSPDPRATLTIFAAFSPDERDSVWEIAQALANDAQRTGFGVRVVMEQRETSDIYASLAYDTAARSATLPDQAIIP